MLTKSLAPDLCWLRGVHRRGFDFCGFWFWQGPGKAVVPDSVTSGPELVDWLHRELQQRKVSIVLVCTNIIVFFFFIFSRGVIPLDSSRVYFVAYDGLDFWR